MMYDALFSVKSHFFTAGFESKDGKVVSNSAPIIKYFKGWSLQKTLEYCEKRGWEIDIVEAKYTDY